MKATLIKKMCPAMKDVCKVLSLCPTDAIRYVADEAERMGGRIEIAAAACNGCGLCSAECCGRAIEMV